MHGEALQRHASTRRHLRPRTTTARALAGWSRPTTTPAATAVRNQACAMHVQHERDPKDDMRNPLDPATSAPGLGSPLAHLRSLRTVLLAHCNAAHQADVALGRRGWHWAGAGGTGPAQVALGRRRWHWAGTYWHWAGMGGTGPARTGTGPAQVALGWRGCLVENAYGCIGRGRIARHAPTTPVLRSLRTVDHVCRTTHARASPAASCACAGACVLRRR